MSQTYTQITPYIHLLTNKADRAKIELEIVMNCGGSFFEPAIHSGKKHLMEHCIASRTKSMDYKTFKDYQFSNNIAINAYTGPLPLAVNAETHESKFEQTFEALAQMIFEPTFDQAILDQEKEIVLREITERRGSPDYILHYWTMQQLFDNDSQSVHETLGNSEMVAQTTISDFEALHQQSLLNSHIFIKVSGGGLDPEFIKTTIQNYLDQKDNVNIKNVLNFENKKAINYRPKNDMKKFDYLPLVHDLAHEQAELSLNIPFILTFENQPKTKLFQELFTTFYGVIYSRLRDELGYVYGLSGYFNINTQLFEISMSCEIKYIKPIVDEIKGMLSDFDKYFDPTKYDQLKQILTMKQDIAADQPYRANHHTESMLRTFGELELYADYAKRLDKVSSQDIKEVYEELHSNLDKLQVLVVSKDKNIEDVKL